MPFVDRSRVELDWTCARAYYWGYEWQGIGLAPMQKDKDLQFGGWIADQLKNIKEGKPWNVKAFSGEEQRLAEALLIGYELVVWPRWLRDYEVVCIEKEMPLDLGAFTYNSRPDTVVRRKTDGTIWYGPEDKTTAWLDSLLTYGSNIQLHATAFCIEANGFGDVAGAFIQGLYKGFTKEEKFYHPLVYAYLKEGIPGITPDQWSAKWTRGWERETTRNFPDGVKGWISKMAKDGGLESVFPNSQPVTLNRTLARKYLDQVVIRQKEVAEWRLLSDGDKEKELDRVFPQSFNQCDQFSKSRKPCQFKELCFNPTAKRFPLTFYKKRQPHHENELAALGATID